MTKIAGRDCYLFQLRPFAFTWISRGLTFGGSLQRLPGILSIEYRLEGDLRSVVWPVPNLEISRRYELWRQTCFELFFGIPGEAAYWEVNLSPDGCWNLYHFTGYRQGMREDAAVDMLTSRITRESNRFSLSCRIDALDRLFPDWLELEVGVAAVVMETMGAAAYWAIDHIETAPDFHCRRSFLITLPGVTSR